MARSARLLELIQALRRRRNAVTAAILAEELGVSLRTLYRDIATLQGQGAPIEGEAGLGYVLRPGFFLPPAMFTEDELDTVLLGLRLVMQRDDPALERAADDAQAKIVAMLPPTLEDRPRTTGLLAGPRSPAGKGNATLGMIRQAMQSEHKLRMRYSDKRGTATERIIWPVAIGFFEAQEVLAAWCETRQDFRHFRLDRIVSLLPVPERYPTRRRILLANWRALEGIDG